MHVIQALVRAMRPMPADSGPDYVGPTVDETQLLLKARMAMFIKTLSADRGSRRIAIIPGGRFAPHLNRFPMAAPAATTWFREHLGGNYEIH
jgi:hypothetical protein